jgi:hypothetical protein
MAFPGTFNISYYRGDTYEFRIYPKTSSGASFDLTSFSDSPSDHVKFTIASARGTGSIGSTVFTATLTSGSSEVTLTTGATSQLSIGQKIVLASGTGDFADDVIITSITNETKFVVSANHTTSGAVQFKTASVYSGAATVSADKTYITCAIPPTVGLYLLPNSTYVYDVEIKNSASPYDYIYTILTGSITVTDHISGVM